VPIGADDGAGFRSADSKQFNRCEFVSQKGSTVEGQENHDIAQRERERVSGIRGAFAN
jgi:hypothetical protein